MGFKPDYREAVMRISPTLLTAISAAWLLAAPAAHAFTLENSQPDANRFDLDEQMRQFRAGESPSSGGQVQKPFAGGSLQFGVQQGPSYFGGTSTVTRQDFNRVVTPESLR